MADNIDKVLARGEKLDTLVDKTDSLMSEVRCAPGRQAGSRGRARCSQGRQGQRQAGPARPACLCGAAHRAAGRQLGSRAVRLRAGRAANTTADRANPYPCPRRRTAL